MAGFFDPFTPGATADPTAGVDPSTYDKVRNEWNAFMDDPHGRAALLSAGLALMQPPSFGDTGASQIARAVGTAGESATSNQATDMKQQELSSKQDLRASQATAAETRAEAASARAGTAEARIGTAGARLELQREQMKNMNERNLLGNRVRLSGMYQNYVKDIAKRNSDPLRSTPPDPVLPMSDWIKQNPMLANMGLVPSSDVADDEAADNAGTGVSPPTTTSTAPQAPRDAAARQPNTIYTTPKGPLKWTGTGWVSP